MFTAVWYADTCASCPYYQVSGDDIYDDVMTRSFAHPESLRVVVTDINGNAAYDTVAVTVILDVHVYGDSIVDPAPAHGHYCATTTGRGPYSYSWDTGFSPTSSCTDASFCQDDLSIRCSVTDANGNAGFGSKTVTLTEECCVPPDCIAARLVVHDDGGRIQNGSVLFPNMPAGQLELQVVDVAGRIVARPWVGKAKEGGLDIYWRSQSLSPGVYFYRLRSDHGQSVRRFVLLK